MSKQKEASIEGLVSWTLRNEDGSVAAEGEGKNLVVDQGRIFGRTDTAPVTGEFLFIADDPHAVTTETTQLWCPPGSNSSFSNVYIDVNNNTWNSSTLIRTMSGSFPTPITTRTITHIGMASPLGMTPGNDGITGQIFSALQLNPSVVQSTTQLFEVNYKFVVTIPDFKRGQRYPQASQDTNKNLLQISLLDAVAVREDSLGGVLLPYTFGKYYFIDDGAQSFGNVYTNFDYRAYNYRGSYAGFPSGSLFNPSGTSPVTWYLASTGINYNRSRTLVIPTDVVDYGGVVGLGVNMYGAWGMQATGYASLNGGGDAYEQSTLNTQVGRAIWGYYPLAYEHGKVGPLVFPHPVGRTFMFNEPTIDKTGQGDLFVQGPYIPKDVGAGSPMHWNYRVMTMDSGGTSAGTEGLYAFDKFAWFARSKTRAAVERSSTQTFTYVANDGGSGNSAITRASGTFRGEGFLPDNRVRVSGTASNNGTSYRIIKVEALKLTLEGLVLADEGPVTSTIESTTTNAYSNESDRFLGSNPENTTGWRTTRFRAERNTAAEGSTEARYNHYRQVYDGIDSFWGLRYRNAAQGNLNQWTMVRWRAMTGEMEFSGTPNPLSVGFGAGDSGNPLLDTTRFVRHSNGAPIGMGDNATVPYALATNRQGRVFYGQRNTDETSANNSVFVIDNSKPGRWYQRDTGTANGTTTFVVDSADEIHAMFPFVAGDVGGASKIRIVGSSNGNDGLYSIVGFTDANTVILNAPLVAENDLRWHWTTIDEVFPDVGELRGLVCDAASFATAFPGAPKKLWALGSKGFRVSSNNGQTWSTLLDESTPGTPLIDADSRREIQVGDIDQGCGGYDVDRGGALYWISLSAGGDYLLNKLEPNSGIGVDAVHSRISFTTDFPAANKPTSIDNLLWEKGVDNPTQYGALWIFSKNRVSTKQSWYRMAIQYGPISSPLQLSNLKAHNPNTFTSTSPPSQFTHANTIIALPSGRSFVRSAYATNTNYLLFDPAFAEDPDNAYSNFGNITNLADRYTSSVRQEAFRPDGCFWYTMYAQEHGWFGSFNQPYRYAPGEPVSGGGGVSTVAGAAAGRLRLTGLSGMTAASVGRFVELSNAASAANNKQFVIMSVNSPTSVDVYAPAGVVGDANNASIDWQEKDGEWVQWAGTGQQFDAYYNTVLRGRRPMHADFQELRDNVQVRFAQAGGATAPEDEFVEGECFDFIASFGEHKTNVERVDVTFTESSLATEIELETEVIKTPVGPNGLATYFEQNSQTTATPAVLGSKLTANGKDWGWEPFDYYPLMGLGLTPNSDPSGANSRPSWRAALDLGAATEITKLIVSVSYGVTGTNPAGGEGQRYFSQTNGQRCTDLRVFSAPDPATLPVELDATLAWPPNTNNSPSANVLGKWITIQGQRPPHDTRTYAQYRIIIDLAGAGLSAAQRTARLWQVAAAHATSGNIAVHLAAMWAVDTSGNIVGLSPSQFVDEAFDADFAGVSYVQGHWIQNVYGGGDPGGGTLISTTDDGDGDGVTDRVTLDAGQFDVLNIDITQDYLAWKEPGSPAVPGYLRAGVAGNKVSPAPSVSNATVADQTAFAMSRIIDISTPGQIIVEDDMIPDNLSGVQWEVRRPAGFSSSRNSTSGDSIFFDPSTGALSHQPANEPPTGTGRRFRITKKAVHRK